MILKDQFYTIKSIKESNSDLEANISINPSHEIFSGHFPGNPITPGVVQMEMIKEILSVHFKKPLKLKAVDNCKFLALLNPAANSDLTVKIRFLSSDESVIKISGTITSESTRFLQIQSEYYFN
ncbi:MAG: 3-hydroxyacyl-ACP dehydratase [Bacteroidota bacterium]